VRILLGVLRACELTHGKPMNIDTFFAAYFIKRSKACDKPGDHGALDFIV
jgi:hypothetical protein